MDRQKVRKLLKQSHPKHKIVEQQADSRYASDSKADDVDVSGLSPKTWKKFGAAAADKPADAAAADSDLRERFRPKKLTGAGSGSKKPAAARSAAARRAPGKLTLERLVPEDAAADSEESIDVLVDEDSGVIGESDSGPEKD